MKTLFTTIVMLLFISLKAQTTYYVSPSGDDTANGTLNNPWASPVKAGVTAQAGDTVLFKEGVYTTGIYCLNSGSEEEGYITYSNYNDDLVIFDGQGVPHYNEEYNIWFEGFICNGDPGLLERSSYLRFNGINIRNYETWFGILMMGPSSHIEITNCKVYDSTTFGGHAVVMFAQLGTQNGMNSGMMTNVILDGNEVYNNNTGGNEQMTIYGEVDGFEMTNNIVHDGTNICMDVIGRDIHLGQPFGRPINGLIKGNICYNSGAGSFGSGIYTDGAGKPELPNSIVIEENICFNNDFCGIEIGDEHEGEISGGVLIQNNIVYGNGFYGIWVGGGFNPPGEVHNVNVFNNTSFNNGFGELAFGPSNNVVVKNNIFLGTATSLYNIYVEGDAVDVNNIVDNNCWYPESTFLWNGSEYSSFTEFVAATGQSQNGIMVDPLLVDPSALDFKLQESSPCIDMGTEFGAPNIDFEGTIRPQGAGFDIGAYEYINVLGINENSLSEVIIFPNPTKNKVYLSEILRNTRYQIISPLGVIVQNGVIETDEIDLSKLKLGMYILKLEDRELGKVNLQKLIIK